jgi:hypothetical protein
MANTNNVNKTGGKEEPNIVSRNRIGQHRTHNLKAHNSTTQKTKKMSNTDPIKKPGLNSEAHEWKAVPASYKTPVVLLIYTVKSGTSIDSDKGKKTST